MKTFVVVVDPWEGIEIQADVTDLTQGQFEYYAANMDADILADVRGTYEPCTPGELLAAYFEVVGPEHAGKIFCA